MKTLNVPMLGEYEASLIDSFSDADYGEYRAAYSELSRSAPVNMSVYPDYFRPKTENFPETRGPFIILLKKDSRTEALAIGRICRQVVEMRIGQFYVLKPRRYALIVPEDGIMVRDGAPEPTRALMKALRHSFKEKRFTLAHLYWLPQGSVEYLAALESRPCCLKAAFSLTSEHWYTDLEKSLGDMVAKRSKRHRGNLRRLMKTLDDDQARFRLRAFRQVGDVDRLMEDAEGVVSRTYQRAWDVGFHRNLATEQIAFRAASSNDLLGFVLYADGKPCAFQLGITFGDVHNIMYMAHDPAFDDWNPGTYLLLKSFEALCAEGKARVVDYGWGDGTHKRRFGDRHRLESNIMFFAPTLDGFTLCALLSFFRLVSVCFKKIATIFGVRDYIKKMEKAKNGMKKAGESDPDL